MNTIENNKTIAEFMGAKQYDKEDDFLYFDEIDNIFSNDTISIKNLKYQSDWNWIMLVVEKIENYYTPNYYSQIATEKDYCCSLDIHTDSVCITVHFKQKNPSEKRKYKQFIKGVSVNKIEAVYNACLAFINWYNSQDKK